MIISDHAYFYVYACVQVMYVDYGNEDRIHMDYVCALPRELTDVPAQVCLSLLRCTLVSECS